MRDRIRQSAWWWLAIGLTAAKLWLTRSQPVYGIGPAIHDDRLFAELAGHIIRGEWLGPYNQLTLAKGPAYPLFLAANFWLGWPLGFTQQLLYALGCAVLVFSLRPWVRHPAASGLLYLTLLLNPMSFEGPSLSRLMRQNLTTPLVLLVLAGCCGWLARRHRPWCQQAGWAVLAGLSLGVFWLTREEGIWLIPALTVLGTGAVWSLRRQWRTHLKAAAGAGAFFVAGWTAPLLVVSTLNFHYYGWFGTVEFRAPEFQDAYGALTRLKQDPVLVPAVAVSQQMRESAYAASPSFAKLRPLLEGPVGEHWADHNAFGPNRREILGGWFMWALRDAVAASGQAADAGKAMAYYQRVATELNAACDSGRIPAGPRRRGFMPALHADQLPSVVAGELDYLRFFLGFKAFSARAPESSGDYAELLPIREITRDRLTPAPRDPAPSTPDQERINAWKLDVLDRVGSWLCIGDTLFIGLAHLIILIRLFEPTTWSRPGRLLLLAFVAWLASLTQLTVNTLVHVTSFEYQYPAAMAPSYPLMLLFAGLVLIDSLRVWTARWRWYPTPEPKRLPSPLGIALFSCGVASVILAFRLREIHLYTGDVAINDQWKIEAADLLLPWLQGTLRPWHFLIAHFEHLPVWTRLLSWAEVALTGRWDPLLQATVNSVLYILFAGLLLRRMARTVTGPAFILLSLLILACGSLPHAWENTTWGFQSQFPWALLFLILYGDATHRLAPGSRGWWWGQLAGLAGLFTLASMWLAPLAALGASLWVQPRGQRIRYIGLGLVAVGLGAIVVIRAIAPPGGAFAQTAGSPLHFLHALLDLLSWPTSWPGALIVMNLPFIVFVLRLRGQADATPFDRLTMTLGLWSWGQAAALAYARSADYTGYVSRYGDLLVVGLLANGLALARMAPVARRWHPLLPMYALVWGALTATGLISISTTGHTTYFHEHAAAHAKVRRDAVQAYLTNHDQTQLENPGTRWLLYQDVSQVTGLLDEPKFRQLLPASVNPFNPPTRSGTAVRFALEHWHWLLAAGCMLAAGGFFTMKSGSQREYGRDDSAFPSGRLLRERDWQLAALAALLAFASLLCWPNWLTFDQSTRWRQLIQGPGSLGPLTLKSMQPLALPDSRLVGAAPLAPAPLRDLFFGTAPEGPELTGTFLSSRFTIGTPWLVVPCAGFPVSHGNGLRIRIEDQAGGIVTEVAHPGPNPTEISFWTADVRPYLGQTARLVLYDGRTGTEAWVAAAPPIATNDPELAGRLAARLRLERLASTHSALGWICLSSILLLAASWLLRPAGPERH